MSGPVAPLRQMVAALQDERHALAALDLDTLLATTRTKAELCDRLEARTDALDAESAELLRTARRLNEVNRRIRNMVSARVAARIEALGGPSPTYEQPRAPMVGAAA